MVFSSFTFLFLFLPLVLIGNSLTYRTYRNHFLLVVSYFFYGWGAPQVLPLLLVTTFLDYRISAHLKTGGSKGKRWLALGVGYNLLILAYYKYANFFIAEGNAVLESIGRTPLGWQEVILPIGVSFFTFQKISFLVDVSRGKAERPSCFVDYALFVALFPQLIAGPIIRFHEIASQLRERILSSDNFYQGVLRFSLGLAKKVLIADYLSTVADQIFALPPQSVSPAYLWLGLFAYSFQIYFDFSGYSDMAIGLGRMLGFSFPENFHQPYRARSFTEFWRRWHMTLSHWMKEYLYIPLGGNRRGAARTYCNLWLVFVLSGLWHGADWTFILWGVYHGAFLVLERRFPVFRGSIFFTFMLVSLGWVLFRASSLSHAVAFYQGLFGLLTIDPELLYRAPLLGEILPQRTVFVFMIAFICSFYPLERAAAWFQLRVPSVGGAWLRGTTALMLFTLSLCALAGLGFSPFLYFKF